MTIQQLIYVITISEAGSLNKAAETLYISQPSLTSSMQELEKELGITIFNRSGRGVSLTNDGLEFMQYARHVVQQYDRLMEKYGNGEAVKKKFGVSTQHYSFAVKSFVEMVKQFNMDEYEFAIRETKTREVIDDVAVGRSEIGILYLSDFNRKAIEKILKSNSLEFHHLIDCDAYVYIWKNHPLAKKKVIRFDDLKDYPCLSFEQGAAGSFYFAEEILSTSEYPRTIKANDRATMLNLMVGLNGYTLCSGIICEELNGSDYIAVPFKPDEKEKASKMEIGYISKKNMLLSNMAKLYIEELDAYLNNSVK
ncbi:MAG: LysR family transcriptional regulator [Lachnospiraceae bacterium]|nr:LysR family transcriptional regulator [Lachnospiraceae bacterium]